MANLESKLSHVLCIIIIIIIINWIICIVPCAQFKLKSRHFNNKLSDIKRFAEKMRLESGFKKMQLLGILDEVRQRVPG